MDFMKAVKNELYSGENNVSVTENGAIGYRTTGKTLLDLNFSVASLRGKSEKEIADRFRDAAAEDPVMAMRWLFYARDVRGGLGERRLFRAVISDIAETDPRMVNRLIRLVPEFGRWDDLWCLLKYPSVSRFVSDFVKDQIREDEIGRERGLPISLLAKWMPSINTSSENTRKLANTLCKDLGYSQKEYREILSSLRRYLNVVETKMSAQRWGEIKYEAVPSRANLIYNSAFLRHDENRRRKYLDSLERGDAKINASVLFPHDIVHKILSDTKNAHVYEQMWKALPDLASDCGSTMVVADGSGSMMCRIGNSECSALDVANAIAIYFAERLPEPYRGSYITFSNTPQYVNLGSGTLLSKLRIAHNHNEVANTNIKAVFDLVLKTAISNHLGQDDLPKNILIISDMEFDRAAYRSNSKSLFDGIREKYRFSGYDVPRLVFWNVNSRTQTIPVVENKYGVALVSGFSVNICKMVMSGKTDPYDCLVDTLSDPRYDCVEEAVFGRKKASNE